MKFKEKVQSMSAKEIIMAMVEGLENPYTTVDMGTFGEKSHRLIPNWVKPFCYGCAATNAICVIRGTTHEFSENSKDRWLSIDEDIDFVQNFEFAIDHLRKGEVDYYNRKAELHGFAKIKSFDMYLPFLSTEDYKLGLRDYRKLAESQESLG